LDYTGRAIDELRSASKYQKRVCTYIYTYIWYIYRYTYIYIQIQIQIYIYGKWNPSYLIAG